MRGKVLSWSTRPPHHRRQGANSALKAGLFHALKEAGVDTVWFRADAESSRSRDSLEAAQPRGLVRKLKLQLARRNQRQRNELLPQFAQRCGVLG